MVKELQKDLIQLGYGAIVGDLDGIEGAKTIKAVREFQHDFDLVVDGIAGKKTKAAIRKRKGLVGMVGTLNFAIDEFRCPDKNALPVGGMHPDLLLKLEELRWVLGNRTVRINSGFRTPNFNRRIGGIASSNHLTGKAADIKVFGVEAEDVHAAALKIFEGVGKYKNFTHVDVDDKKIKYIGKY